MNCTQVERLADLSDCGLYRFSLTRIWDKALPWCGWVMLNPSTADANIDDATIRKCMSFARRWGYGGILVRNLFNFRATDPNALLLSRSKKFPLIAPDDEWRGDHWASDELYTGMAETCERVIVAWGAHAVIAGLGRDKQVLRVLRGAKAVPFCLGMNGDGSPRHPLYVRGDTVPFEYAPVMKLAGGGN